MNRGHVLQSSSSVGMQQMMAAGNPNWSSSSSPFQLPPSSHHPSFFIPQFQPSSLPFLPSWYENNNDDNNNNNRNTNQEFPESWSQFILGGLVSEDDKANGLRQLINQAKKLEEWEEHILRNQSHPVNNNGDVNFVEQENSSSFVYGHHGNNNNNEDFHHHQSAAMSTQVIMPTSSSAASASSPNSSTTSFGMNVLDFFGKSEARHPPPSRSSSECNSSASGGAVKKARVQHSSSSSSAQPTFKVRKEKLGDRVTALHQIVSPFGKTDTASVLLEAIGYIRFLHNQIEALSLPYLGIASPNQRQQQQQQHSTTIHGERNCMFPEDPGQLLNDNCTKMKDGYEEPKLDLRSRGLCLVPVSTFLYNASPRRQRRRLLGSGGSRRRFPVKTNVNGISSRHARIHIQERFEWYNIMSSHSSPKSKKADCS